MLLTCTDAASDDPLDVITTALPLVPPLDNSTTPVDVDPLVTFTPPDVLLKRIDSVELNPLVTCTPPDVLLTYTDAASDDPLELITIALPLVPPLASSTTPSAYAPLDTRTPPFVLLNKIDALLLEDVDTS